MQVSCQTGLELSGEPEVFQYTPSLALYSVAIMSSVCI